jgi:hypothetical protein
VGTRGGHMARGHKGSHLPSIQCLESAFVTFPRRSLPTARLRFMSSPRRRSTPRRLLSVAIC